MDPLEQRVQALASEVASLRSRAQDRTPLSIPEAARRLGVSRGRTLLPAITVGTVATVAWGERVRISLDEIERLESIGFGRKKVAPKRERKRSSPARDFPKDFDSEMARLRAKKLFEIVK